MSNKSGFQPFFDRVLIKPMEVSKTTDWGFLVSTEETSEREQLANTTGIVVAIGPDVTAGMLTVGMKVAYAKYAGLMYTGKDGNQYRMISEENLVAQLDDDMDLVDPHLTKGMKK